MAMSERPPDVGVDREATRNLALMLVLTFATGVVDAGGFLGFDTVFLGNMTGNVLILGMGAAGADGLPVFSLALALIAFIVGAGIASLFLRSGRRGWSPRLTAVLVVSASLVAGTSVLVWLQPTEHVAVMFAIGMTAGAMGMQAAVARNIGVADVTTVVVTSTITAWAIDMFARPSRATILNRRVAAIVTILVGALVGALLVKVALWSVFAVAAGVSAVVVVCGHVLASAGSGGITRTS
ncbi:YoaK family protein [Gordonia alkanivorans]|uniref:YoaK family protein n=1 Tax=Gordonia alkanivorans TaxID=84096 RepID=UPI00244D5984|nr:YoaK family protein [Gordonia alkanivorans]MDH3009173.1 YoaK family protein [Gordonia alkanivorans]